MANKKVVGIYKITDIETDRVYIGQSVDIKKRWTTHKREFIKGDNKLDLYQECRSPEFELITTCEESRLDELEIFYIGLYDSFLNGFNMTIGGQYSMSDSVQLVMASGKILNGYEFHKMWQCGIKSGLVDEEANSWEL